MVKLFLEYFLGILMIIGTGGNLINSSATPSEVDDIISSLALSCPCRVAIKFRGHLDLHQSRLDMGRDNAMAADNRRRCYALENPACDMSRAHLEVGRSPVAVRGELASEQRL